MKANRKHKDRRIDRTRRALRQVLLDLIAEEGYADITVEELTARAGVSRATFYLHYRDKEDLLLDYLSELADEKVQALADFNLADWGKPEHLGAPGMPPIQPFLDAFQHVAEYADLYRLVMRSEGATRLHIGHIISSSVNAFLQTRLLNQNQDLHLQVSPEFLSAYFSGAFLGTITWWLEEASEVSPEEVTLQFQRMLFPGLRRALGLENQLGAQQPASRD
jgi:AcrR family transcriptional regulator